MQRNPEPIETDSLYGRGGLKYVVGGILLRKAEGWLLKGKEIPKANCCKMAKQNSRNLHFIRNRVLGMIVPLSCVVDYFGHVFECFSILPISLNSLVLGSDDEAFTVKTDPTSVAF